MNWPACLIRLDGQRAAGSSRHQGRTVCRTVAPFLHAASGGKGLSWLYHLFSKEYYRALCFGQMPDNLQIL
jgi:hypothetical protein